MPETEANKKDEPMVELDVTGNPVDVELKDSKVQEVEEVQEVQEEKEEVAVQEESPKVEVKKEDDGELEDYSDTVKKRINK